MKTFERKIDCPEVEKFIWDKVATSWGDFSGIKEMSKEDLFVLKALVDQQLGRMIFEIPWGDD